MKTRKITPGDAAELIEAGILRPGVEVLIRHRGDTVGVEKVKAVSRDGGFLLSPVQLDGSAYISGSCNPWHPNLGHWHLELLIPEAGEPGSLDAPDLRPEAPRPLYGVASVTWNPEPRSSNPWETAP